MEFITVAIADAKHIPTLGKGPFKKAKIRKEFLYALRSMGYTVTVVDEDARQALTSNLQVTSEEVIEDVQEEPVVTPEEVVEESVVEDIQEENEEVEEKTLQPVTEAGEYKLTSGRTIEITAEELAVITKEDVTKNELKAILKDKAIRFLYKDNLSVLLAKFSIVK